MVEEIKRNVQFSAFLEESEYVDFHTPVIQKKADELFAGILDDLEKVKAAYEFVRDKVPHLFDISGDKIAAKASEVLIAGMGICHAKSNLLAALLRSQGIPAGFCFEHITLAEDDSLGYCIHGYNAVFIRGKWVKLDARGNRPGIDAQFLLDGSKLAYPPRKEYEEYFYPGIYAKPQQDTMDMLEWAKSMQDIMENIPDYLNEKPDIEETEFSRIH